MIDVCLGSLVVSLDQHHLVAEMLVAEMLDTGLDCQLDAGELSSIARHAFL